VCSTKDVAAALLEDGDGTVVEVKKGADGGDDVVGGSEVKPGEVGAPLPGEDEENDDEDDDKEENEDENANEAELGLVGKGTVRDDDEQGTENDEEGRGAAENEGT
jgi:hypothetical protein